MLIKKSKYRRKVMSFVLGSISITFVLIFIISSIGFGIAYKVFKDNNMESAMSKLEMLSITGESTFGEAEAISTSIALESFVDHYKTVPDPLSPDMIFDTYVLINSLQNYSTTFRYADECFVFFELSESIVFDDYFRYMNDYYDAYYSLVYDSYDAYKASIFNSDVAYYEIRPEASNTLQELNTYITLKDAKDYVYAVVKVRINTDDLYNQMQSIMMDQETNAQPVGFVAITTNEEEVLLHVGDEALLGHVTEEAYREFSFAGTEYVSVSVEDHKGFRYSYILPNSVFTRDLNRMTYSFALIFLLLVLVIISIGAYLMKRHAKSIDHIMYMVDGPGKSESLYHKIDTKIQDLIEDNALLTNNLKEEKAILLDMFYEKLFKGTFSNNKDLQNNMEITGTNINGQLYCVGLLYAGDESSDTAIDSIAAKNISIRYAANDVIINELYSYVVICEQIVSVLFVSNTDEDTFRRNMDLFISKFKQTMDNYNYEYYVCLGSIVKEIMLVRKSYSLALLMDMKHKKDSTSGEVYKVSAQDASLDEFIELNDNLKNIIYSLVVKGETKETRDLIEDIINKLIRQAKSKSRVTLHIYVLWELLVKVIKDNNIDDTCECYKYYTYYKNLDLYAHNEQMRLVSKGFVELSEYFKGINVSRTSSLLTKILDFINTEFTNPDLSLVYIADKFGISVTKLSKHFKENNIEYSAYIIQLRMNHAKHILVSTDTSIKSISKQIGYTSSNSFCRAFKRLEGISANEYRNSKR